MLQTFIRLLVAAFLCLQGLTAHAASSVPLNTSVEFFSVQAGADLPRSNLAVLWLNPQSGYYLYAETNGTLGKPVQAEATLTALDTTLQTFYPPGRKKPDPFTPGSEIFVYEGPTPIFFPLPENADPRVKMDLSLSLLLCSETSCFPYEDVLSIDRLLDAEQLDQAREQQWWPTFLDSEPRAPLQSQEYDIPAPTDVTNRSLPQFSPQYSLPGLEVTNIFKAVLLAMLAGFILNFMPCVLPVISLKIRSFLSMEQSHLEQHFRRHNLFFFAGIMTFFLGFALLAAFTGAMWGQAFQSIPAILAMILVVFILGLSLLGVLDLPGLHAPFKKNLPGRSLSIDAFMTGCLVTLLATPCSGPFLGGVLAWTLLQPPLTIAVVFLGIGLGMGLPYLLLAAAPGAIRFMPKPGHWMIYLEHLFGFLLLATVVYLISLLPDDKHLSISIMILLAGAGALIWGKWTDLTQTRVKRWSLRSLALLMVFLGLFFSLTYTERQSTSWAPYSQEEFLSLLGKKNILLEFTADWCPTCKVLEQTVLTDKNLALWHKDHDFIAIKADITRDNEAAVDLLHELGSRSIPLVALFGREQNGTTPVVLRDIFTTSQLKQAMEGTFSSP